MPPLPLVDIDPRPVLSSGPGRQPAVRTGKGPRIRERHGVPCHSHPAGYDDDVDEVARGTEIVFSCDPGGRLTASVGNAPRPPIASRSLCRALFDVYLRQDPIERDGKRNIIAGFARLLVPAHGAEDGHQ